MQIFNRNIINWSKPTYGSILASNIEASGNEFGKIVVFSSTDNILFVGGRDNRSGNRLGNVSIFDSTNFSK